MEKTPDSGWKCSLRPENRPMCSIYEPSNTGMIEPSGGSKRGRHVRSAKTEASCHSRNGSRSHVSHIV